MRTRTHLLVALGTGLLGACSPWKYVETDAPSGPGPSGQTYAQAVQVVCDVDRLAELDPAEPDELADAKRIAYLEKAVDNPDGIELRTLLSVKFGSERECLLRDAQHEAKLTSCKLADRTLGAASTKD